ncbi:tetratricopeptide repeat protein [Myxococcaceae bacterium JPH2]|nr:tetratricopeptide repeat protein [Myxococcaceae bacterium JPH2]
MFLALLVYAGALANGFVYDDVSLLLENPWIRSLDGLRTAWGQSLFGFAEDPTEVQVGAGYYRPLAHVTFFMLRAVFGTSPWGYHLLLVLAHAAASVLVWWLLRFCLRRGQPSAPAEWAAVVGASLFAVHPVHVEAVAWISGWMDLGATLAVLIAVRLLFPAPVSWGRSCWAAVAWLAGLLLKETAIILPVLVWSLELLAAEGESRGLRVRLRRYGPLALALGLYATLRLNALGWVLPRTSHHMAQGSASGLDALALVTELGGKLFWPHPLVAVPPSTWVRSVWEPRVLMGGLTVAALVGLLLLSRRLGSRALGAGLVWWWVPLLPVLVLQAGGVEAYAERYLYLPSVGFIVVFAVALREVLTRWPRGTRAAMVASVGMMVIAALLTGLRVPVWHDAVSLWEDTVSRAPGRALAHAWLGAAYLHARRVEDALPHLEVAAKSLPGEFRVRSDLAVAYAQLGHFDKAIRELEAAVRLKPGSATPRHNLGLALRRAKRMDDALVAFREASQLDPEFADARLELGRTLLQLGRAGEAVQPLEDALRLRPDSEPARRALSSARAALTAGAASTAPVPTQP